jgi:RimJ/RimL family protein N-acetyltransferase
MKPENPPAITANLELPGPTGLVAAPGRVFRFELVSEDTITTLHGWLQRPHAAQWWQPLPSLEELRQDYLLQPLGSRSTRGYIAYLGGQPVGFIQCYAVMGSGAGWWEEETDPGARGIDQFLADGAVLGQGLGRSMIRAFVDLLLLDPEITVVQTDPHPSNERAIRCYSAAGFTSAGIVQTPDGPALLMRRGREPAPSSIDRVVSQRN